MSTLIHTRYNRLIRRASQTDQSDANTAAADNENEREAASKDPLEVATMELIAEKARPCPKCGALGMKYFGCDHMECQCLKVKLFSWCEQWTNLMTGPLCKHEYCWQCFASYKLVEDIGSAAHQESCRYHSASLYPETDYDGIFDGEDYIFNPENDDDDCINDSSVDDFLDDEAERRQRQDGTNADCTLAPTESLLWRSRNGAILDAMRRDVQVMRAQLNGHLSTMVSDAGLQPDNNTRQPVAASSISEIPIRQHPSLLTGTPAEALARLRREMRRDGWPFEHTTDHSPFSSTAAQPSVSAGAEPNINVPGEMSCTVGDEATGPSLEHVKEQRNFGPRMRGG